MVRMGVSPLPSTPLNEIKGQHWLSNLWASGLLGKHAVSDTFFKTITRRAAVM